jgi:hypothetical protein
MCGAGDGCFSLSLVLGSAGYSCDLGGNYGVLVNMSLVAAVLFMWGFIQLFL